MQHFIILFSLLSVFIHVYALDFQIELNSPKTSNNNTTNIGSKLNYTPELKLVILLGSSRQKFRVRIETGSFVLWVPSKESNFKTQDKYDKTKSSSYYSVGEPINVNGLIQGTPSTETIVVEEFFRQVFHWVLAEEWMSPSVESINGAIGFGRKYTDPYNENQSILAVISKEDKVFTIERNALTQYSFTLARGKAFLDTNNKKGYCNMPVNGSYWECRISHIMFGPVSNETFKGNAISVYKEAIFDTGKSVFVFPFEYSDLFIYKLNEYNAECDYEKITSGTKTIYCNKTENVDFISFVFNGYALKMSHQELFINNNFLIQFEKINNVFIGMPFFSFYSAMFDNYDQQMAFLPYNLKLTADYIVNVQKYTTDNDYVLSEHPIVIASVVIGFIIVLGIGVYFFIKLWKMNIMQEFKYITKLEDQSNNNNLLFEE